MLLPMFSMGFITNVSRWPSKENDPNCIAYSHINKGENFGALRDELTTRNIHFYSNIQWKNAIIILKENDRKNKHVDKWWCEKSFLPIIGKNRFVLNARGLKFVSLN